MKRILLVSMPFGALERPALGLSLLKARLVERGVACDVAYLNVRFAELISYEDYQWVSLELPYTAFAGDWTFTAALYGDRPRADEAYVQRILLETWRLPAPALSRLMRVRALTEPFLAHCLESIPWRRYALVGFTSTFEQNIASLALARRLKVRHPRIAIAFGGANWEADMGAELHARFRFVDYVCSGEAEESFPALVARVLAHEPVDAPAIAGIVHRAGDRSVVTPAGPPVRDLDTLPVPDFSDYFRALEETPIGAAVAPTLLFETSRGCWWGAKSQCTFCGLNGGTMAFRSKSPARALAELDHLVGRWRVEQVEAVDNILDMRYFTDVLPALARGRRGLRLFYEVKANLSRDQVRLLRDAGVRRIQPGIESLSDHVLALMRKGTTALRNVQLLKWCREYGVAVDWNILYGFPGETARDYAEMLELARAIRFLPPPSACGPIRLDRFSPYHAAPERFGIVNVRPLAPYGYLYPFEADSVARIAYYFDFDYAPGHDPSGHAADMIEFVEHWRRQPDIGTLAAVGGADGALRLVDTRADAARQHTELRGPERSAYEHCDEARTATAVARHLEAMYLDHAFEERAIVAFLDSLVANRLMVTDGRRYLSLAIRVQPAEAGAAAPLVSGAVSA